MDVGNWLISLGLDQYEAAFRENGVSAEVLSLLTADDLKELGVAEVFTPGSPTQEIVDFLRNSVSID